MPTTIKASDVWPWSQRWTERHDEANASSRFLAPVHQRKRARLAPRPSSTVMGGDLEVHAAHAAARGHAAAGLSVLLRQLGHHGFGRDQESRNRSCVLDRRAHDLGRVDDALLHEVAVLTGLRVEAVIVRLVLEDLADDDGAVLASVDRDLTSRP